MHKIELKEEAQAMPKCPHCDNDIRQVSFRELHGGMLGKRYIYFCSSCRGSLGVSHRKGFWMG